MIYYFPAQYYTATIFTNVYTDYIVLPNLQKFRILRRSSTN